MNEAVNKIKKGVEKIVDWVMVILFLMIFAVGVLQVIMRALRNPLTWSEELIRLTYIWLCFLGWVIATRNGSHISITVLLNSLPPLPQKIMRTFNSLLVILFSVFIIRYGFSLAYIGRVNRAIVIPVNFIVVYAIVPASNILILFYKIIELFTIWTASPKERTA
jgi:TRAP-type C4-dicarboxylate transport system permease small subunit